MTDSSDDPTFLTSAFVLLRELGDLRYDGIVTEEEFAAKRAELLARI